MVWTENISTSGMLIRRQDGRAPFKRLRNVFFPDGMHVSG
jgi:hypothetical protein